MCELNFRRGRSKPYDTRHEQNANCHLSHVDYIANEHQCRIITFKRFELLLKIYILISNPMMYSLTVFLTQFIIIRNRCDISYCDSFVEIFYCNNSKQKFISQLLILSSYFYCSILNCQGKKSAVHIFNYNILILTIKATIESLLNFFIN